MKDFASWISDMANSIPDGSTVVDARKNKLAPSKAYSELQLRIMLADTVVPALNTVINCERWISVFRTDAHLTGRLTLKPMDELLDKDIVKMYAISSDLAELTTFINAVREQAKRGE